MASGLFTCDVLESTSNGGNPAEEVRPDREHCCMECCNELNDNNKEDCRRGCSQAAVDNPEVCDDNGNGICSRRGINYFLGRFAPDSDESRLFCCLTQPHDGVFIRANSSVFLEEDCIDFKFDAPTKFPTKSPTGIPTSSPTRSPTIGSNEESIGVFSEREQQVLLYTVA
eukprot:snap_masked-scaffold_62-processed-gene-0.23-mRNA-1 protein AED:0.36 eAED:1.00 QI:0/0/0/1/1/1/2/0/169